MTCIVGVLDKENNRVIIGGDSAASTETGICVRKDPKVFQNKNFIMGCTSSFRMIQLLRFSFNPPEKDPQKDLYAYMCTDFINAVRLCFKEGGYAQKTTEGEDKGGIFLVGIENRLFRIDCDFQVGESYTGTEACGCGQDFALGALYALRNSKISPENKIIRALEAAEELALGVKGPFIILNT